MTNVLEIKTDISPIADLFLVIGQPVRLQILLTIGRREVCVCHIEESLGIRQAAISQHLMVLRNAGLVSNYRAGRNFYYRMVRPELLDLILEAAKFVAMPVDRLNQAMNCPLQECP